MSLTPVALVLPTVQRHHLEPHPDERAVVRHWAAQVEAARSAGQLVVLVQWDGREGSGIEAFSRGWTLHPDFRAETGDLLVRMEHPEAWTWPERGVAELWDELHGRAVRELRVLALPDDPLAAALMRTAQEQGFRMTVLEPLPAPPLRRV